MQSPFPTDNEWHMSLIEVIKKGPLVNWVSDLNCLTDLEKQVKFKNLRLELRSLPQNLLKRTVISSIEVNKSPFQSKVQVQKAVELI